jgi:hypothetical protein
LPCRSKNSRDAKMSVRRLGWGATMRFGAVVKAPLGLISDY